MFFNSLLLQTDKNWECIVMDEADNLSLVPEDKRFSYYKFDRVNILVTGRENNRGSLGLLPKDSGSSYLLFSLLCKLILPKILGSGSLLFSLL